MTLNRRFWVGITLGTSTLIILFITDGILQEPWLNDLVHSEYLVYGLFAFWFVMAPLVPFPVDRSDKEA